MMLVPAAVLVMIVLAAIGADISHAHMARATLADLTDTIANDMATRAISVERLRQSGEYHLDGAEASRLVQDRIDHRSLATLEDISCTIPRDFTAGTTLVVSCTGSVEHLFGKGLPGTDDRMRLSASSTVNLIEE